jgi:hypothetical protein
MLLKIISLENSPIPKSKNNPNLHPKYKNDLALFHTVRYSQRTYLKRSDASCVPGLHFAHESPSADETSPVGQLSHAICCVASVPSSSTKVPASQKEHVAEPFCGAIQPAPGVRLVVRWWFLSLAVAGWWGGGVAGWWQVGGVTGSQGAYHR